MNANKVETVCCPIILIKMHYGQQPILFASLLLEIGTLLYSKKETKVLTIRKLQKQ